MTEEERQLNSEKVSSVIDAVCLGNKAAASFLWSVAFIVRTIDDERDGDHEYDITKAFAEAMIALPRNPFYAANAASLSPVILLAFNAWEDSNIWDTNGGVRRRYALVIRDYINELCQLTAYLVGGWDHMRNTSLAVREAFLKDED